jgi:hypothetical protein
VVVVRRHIVLYIVPDLSSVIFPPANPLINTKGRISALENRSLNRLVAPLFFTKLPRLGLAEFVQVLSSFIDTSTPTEVFVVGALFCILEPTPSADVIDRQLREIMASVGYVIKQTAQPLAPGYRRRI